MILNGEENIKITGLWSKTKTN